MKKTHWFRNTLLTLIACGLIGLIVAVIKFNGNPGRTGATSTIEFSFEGAAEGVAPNGIRFDLNGFTSESVLNAALADAGMVERYTADQLRQNILVSGVYPEDIVRQMTGYESLLTGDASKVSSTDFHATLYTVTLYDDFDKKISKGDLEKLLTAVMKAFREDFEKTYSIFLAKDGTLDYLSGFDYPQQVDMLKISISRYETFANQMAADHSDFLLGGEGFADIAVRYQNLRTVDLDRLDGQVVMNALSRDADRIIAQYENQIRVLELNIQELEKEGKDIEALIDQYDKDNLIYVSTAETLQQVGSNSSQTYDTLVATRRSVEQTIAENNKEMTDLKLKLADLRGEETVPAPAENASESGETESGETETAETKTTATTSSKENLEARKAVIEKNLATVVSKLNAITEDFKKFLDAYSAREMNDSTVAVTEVKYDAPKILSGTFIILAIKTAGPFCALGFMVCMVLLILSRRREEKTA